MTPWPISSLERYQYSYDMYLYIVHLVVQYLLSLILQVATPRMVKSAPYSGTFSAVFEAPDLVVRSLLQRYWNFSDKGRRKLLTD